MVPAQSIGSMLIIPGRCDRNPFLLTSGRADMHIFPCGEHIKERSGSAAQKFLWKRQNGATNMLRNLAIQPPNGRRDEESRQQESSQF